jgi:putative hydrolase of the HAD superfamily
LPEARPVLEELKGKYTLGIITNGLEAVQHGKLAKLGLAGYFDTVITAQGAGCEKPAAEIFLQALEEVGCDPHEALYVGDSLEADVAGARGVGMVAVWLNRKGETVPEGAMRPDHELRYLSELLAIL